MQMTSSPEKSMELKKHVGAIHSSNYLSLLQRKIANALLYNAFNELQTKQEHQIQISALMELIGYDSKDSQRVKKALVALISTVIEWNLIDKDKSEDPGVWNASAILADASIDGPLCSYSYSNRMRALLHRPEMYGRLNMRVQSKFKSTYGLALYENCVRYQAIGQTPWFELSVFRKLMGVEEGKYIIFRDFKRRVVDAAIKEVNKLASIKIDVQLKKSGRNVTALKFQLGKPVPESFITQELFSPTELNQKLIECYGLSQKQLDHLRAQYDEVFIEEKIKIIECSSSFQSGKIKNLAKYLLNALEQDFQPTKSSQLLLLKMREKKDLKELELVQREEIKQNYHRYQDKMILELFATLPSKKQAILAKGFESGVKNTIYFTLYLKNGLENVLVSDKFCDYIRQHGLEYFPELISFEDFCKQDQQ